MKKLIPIFLLAVLLVCVLTSCGQFDSNPYNAIKSLTTSNAYYVEMEVMTKYIDDWETDDLELNGVFCIIEIEGDLDRTEDEYAIMFFCDKITSAKAIEKNLKYSEEYEEIEEGVKHCTLVRKGKVIFLGSQDILDEMK